MSTAETQEAAWAGVAVTRGAVAAARRAAVSKAVRRDAGMVAASLCAGGAGQSKPGAVAPGKAWGEVCPIVTAGRAA
ncbi:hypothetical protein Pen01_03190 [Phytomonospora endophytica]|nr:hypothetical protein Pen01_03190 [Phytomonospora endophytica]